MKTIKRPSYKLTKLSEWDVAAILHALENDNILHEVSKSSLINRINDEFLGRES